MNNIGKIFITLIFVLSLFFMSFTLVLYGTHKNWKTEYAKVKKQLDEANTKLVQEETRRSDLTNAYQQEVNRCIERITALQDSVKVLDDEKQTLVAENKKLEDEQQQHIEMVKLAHDSMAADRTELDGLRSDNRKLRDDWSTLFTKYVAKTDEAHDLAMKLANYRSVGERLAKDYRDACEVLRKFNLQPKPDVYTGVPPKVEGLVTDIGPNGWIEISIGGDSGIMKGHRLDIFRGNTYIGKVEVVQTEPDKATCQILPEYRKGTVRREDAVAYISLTN